MAESIKTTVVENLPENAAPGDADYIITAQKNILKKTKIAQLVNVFKEKPTCASLAVPAFNSRNTFLSSGSIASLCKRYTCILQRLESWTTLSLIHI